MSSDAYNRFRNSMNVTYEMWHDGVGYDLSAIDAMSPADRKSVESTLLARAGNDWRDLEALAYLDTPKAWAAIEHVARAPGELALRAAEILRQRRRSPDSAALVERRLLDRIKTVPPDASISDIISAAVENPTPAVKAALLDATLFSKNRTLRYHAAAQLLYWVGKCTDPMDKTARPLLLRFTSAIPREVADAHKELRARLSDSPA